MENKKAVPRNIDEYIAGFPQEVRSKLEQVRAAVKKASPDAGEKISYAMPAFMLQGKPLVYFAAFKNHIGFYPLPQGIKAFEEELAGYKTSKGAVQFPLNKPVPVGLIIKIVKFRMKHIRTKNE
jgi:uncharacterized protein YdhG (YjbR/CyaY superfamily)